VNLLNRDGVDPPFDNRPYSGKAPGRIDEIEAPETLGVVVLREGGRLFDVGVNLGHFAQVHPLEVHYSTASLEQVAGLATAGWQARVGKPLILNREVGEHAIRRGNLVHSIQIDST
jgi:hypothetical protein